MSIKFEKISKYNEDEAVIVPFRKTAKSAGYDFYAAEDTIIPPYEVIMSDWTDPMIKDIKSGFKDFKNFYNSLPFSMEELAKLTKTYNAKPTLVPTGIKCELPDGYFLQLSVRSSLPLKHWLVLANGVGIIDADYYNNPDNEGHIYFQLINFSPFPIVIKKGECFGQGVIMKYCITDDDNASGERSGGFGSTNG